MNNKKNITIFSVLALIILAIVIVITIVSELIGFSFILGALFIILTFCLGIYLKEEPDEYSTYNKNKKRILKTYDSIIVEVENIPNIAGKNVIKVKSIEDLVDAQLELREPIYYKNDNDSCFFLLLHFNEACVYILKMSENTISPTEQSIRYMKPSSKKDEKSILENVENTIVYKLDELRSFKISPIRNEKEIQVVDDTEIKKEVASTENKVTSNALEEEISKTMYIKNLKEKMKQFEEESSNRVLAKKEEKKEEKITHQDKIAKVEIEEKQNSKKESPKKEANNKEKKPKVTKQPVKNLHSRRRATNYTNKNNKKWYIYHFLLLKTIRKEK